MMRRFSLLTILIFFLITFSGCEIIGDIFAAGAISAIIGILILVGIIVLIVRAVRR
ncbi:MAG: hypothetical protein WD016_01510 [Balneolaceae bacterium]